MGHSKRKLNKTGQTEDKQVSVKEKLRAKKKQAKKNLHRARLIVRNLPFIVLEDDIRKLFEQYGEIDEIKILKKEDKQLLGCAFVQFKRVQSAAQARHYVNGKSFLNREIECDWALSKTKYQKQKEKEEIVIKEEPLDDSCHVDEVKSEPLRDDPVEIAKEDKGSNEESVSDDDNIEHDVEEISESDADDNEGNSDDEVKPAEEVNTEATKPKVQSNDTVEGKTVFIKNVPFSVTNNDIKECFSKFGPLYYALVCMDTLTEHSKGTAFVKFRNKEDAEKCLSETNLTLMGNVLELHTALARGDLNQKISKSNQKNKDTRNLYLVKEGVILAGSKSAEGVSASDMAKRLQHEQYKTHMLRNLNMIVARTRLVVHNIPANWDDAKLRQLFQKHSSPKVIIKEARIMRNMRAVDGKGVGKSKEFGFVTFTTHEAALDALRSINNNPNIFSANKRPIVAFSIENRARLQAKAKRLHNSRVKNPRCKNYDPQEAKTNPKVQPVIKAQDDAAETSKFAGVAAKPGVKKMRNRFNLKTQAKLHHEQLKKEKKKSKHAKKPLAEKRKEFTKQPRQKINKSKVKEKDDFSKLVNKYKAQLFGSTVGNEGKKKQKWYL